MPRVLNTTNMKIHLLGIAGTKTAPLAIALQDQGHLVSGSDQDQIFPPISTLLKRHHIPINTPLAPSTDLVIVGNSYRSFQRSRLEYLQARKLKLPIVSYTHYLVKNLIKPQSILVAGSYGKTTITALLAFIFLKLKLDPSYMFGGQAVNRLDSTRFGQSPYSIIEACESINGLDRQSTFLYYPAKYVVLTSADWEHKDSFASSSENFGAFKKLVQKIPSDGLLVYNPQSHSACQAARSCQGKTIPYDYSIKIKPLIPGEHNYQNALAAATLCCHLGLGQKEISPLVGQYRGVKRRLELISQKNNLLIYDDFAQSDKRITKALTAIKEKYPHHRLKVFFEPHASFLQYKQSLSEFDHTFSLATEVVLSSLKFSPFIPKDQRVTLKDYQSAIGPKLRYFPDYQQIAQYFRQTLKPNDVLIHFSSGGLQGLNCLKLIAKIK